MYSTCAKIIGVFLMVFSLTLLPPWIFSYISDDGAVDAFSAAMGITLFTGFILWLPVRNSKKPLRTRDGFLIVVLFYVVLSLFGALPFYGIYKPDISLTNAIFESVSGLTTTGSTVLTHIDDLPRSVIYYRQQLQFLGGMGIIVLAVAILPMLGIGGMALFRAEMTGPVKDNKLTPRITQTAKALWFIYVGLTFLCFLGYWLAGMTLFDAINYSFATVATGGYAPHDASMGFYPNNSIKLVAIVFMLLGSLNFSLHFQLLNKFSFRQYWQDAEVKLFFLIALVSTFLISTILLYHQTFADEYQAIIETLFHVVSILSTTGFSASDYTHWPSFAPFLIIMIGLIGGCAGSTSGGIKVIRFLLLIKQASREIKRLIHPNGQFLLKMNHRTVPTAVVDSVVGFIAIYTVIFGLIMIALVATHLDFVTAFSSTIASLANVGPGLELTSVHFDALSDVAKWIIIVAMFIGRLEVFTLIVLLSPMFWRS